MTRHAPSTIRLYVDSELIADATILLEGPQAHYVANVMRMSTGDTLNLFNGRDGEWHATIANTTKTRITTSLDARTREQDHGPDLWLVQAPVKNARMKTIVEKATELGIGAIASVITQHTAVSGINLPRLRANAIEAAEQCGRLSVPAFHDPMKFDQLIDGWPHSRRLVFCDETRAAPPLIDALKDCDGDRAGSNSWGILIGPEGGFSADEVDKLRAQPFVIPAKLGPRILRADTAAIAAISLWQAAAGDWHERSD